MKILFFLTLLITPILSFAITPKCDDVILITDAAFKEHLTKSSISEDSISKSLVVFMNLIDSGKIFLTKDEFANIKNHFTKDNKKILENLLKNDCSDYLSISKTVNTNRSKLLLLVKSKYENKKYTLTKGYEKFSHKEYTEANDYDVIANMIITSFLQKDLKDDLILYYKNNIKPDKLNEISLNNIIKSLIKTLDAHSDYFTTEETEQYERDISGNFTGIGVNLKRTDTPKLGFKILQLMPNGPAFSSKQIEKNDIITKIDGIEITEDNIDDLFNSFRGPLNSKIEITLHTSSNTEKTVTLSRAVINSDEVQTKGYIKTINNKNFLVIKLPVFYADYQKNSSCSNDILNTYNSLHKIKYDGIILDLRDNSGGLLSEAIKLTGLFIDQPVVVQLKNKDTHFVQKALKSPQLITEPLMVLINKGSASASEIVAGALQSYGRGLIVGDSKTFGKGTVQMPINKFQDLGFGMLKTTINQFYLPNGKSTQINGVKSDIVIPFYTEYTYEEESSELYAFPYNETDVLVNKTFIPNSLNHIKKLSFDRISKDHFFNNFKNKESSLAWLESLKETKPLDQDKILDESLNIFIDFLKEN